MCVCRLAVASRYGQRATSARPPGCLRPCREAVVRGFWGRAGRTIRPSRPPYAVFPISAPPARTLLSNPYDMVSILAVHEAGEGSMQTEATHRFAVGDTVAFRELTTIR